MIRNHPYQPTSGKYARIQVEGGYASGYNAGFFASAITRLKTIPQRIIWK